MAEHNHDIQSVSTINPYKAINVVYNAAADTLTRLACFASTAATGGAKDIPLNTHHSTWLRLFKPQTPPPPPNKLPLIIYIHGGGFILGSAADTVYHDFCGLLATDLPAIVVSLNYRLAPESRLPAAYDDAVEAINWVREQALDEEIGEEWLRELSDFSNCYLMGNSAGANIAYHAALRCLPLDMEPVKIVGLILNQAYFGGVERTGSEMRLVNDGLFPLAVNDLMWELSLPRGVDRDHEYCNPTVGSVGRWAVIGWGGRCFVSVHGGDPLMDRQVAIARMMEGEGVKVKVLFGEGGFHGVELFDPCKKSALLVQLKQFMCSPEAIDQYM